MSEQCCYFHAGKGGVGKSTTSALSALHLARTGRNTLLVSLDPAHNQSDIFDMDFTGKPKQVAPNLRAAQADISAWVKKYLQGVEEQVRANYTYQTAFNLESRLNVIKHSPGIEEYALLLAFRHYCTKYRDAEAIVFDMPPTALTTRFFNLPELSLVWLEQLSTLRCEIMEKKEIITRIQLGRKEIECDKVASKLEKQITFYTELRDLFRDGSRCRIHLVVNPDRLSFAEAERIDADMAEMGISLAAVLMNKTGFDSSWDKAAPLMVRHTPYPIPLSPAPLIGVNALSSFLEQCEDNMGFLDINGAVRS